MRGELVKPETRARAVELMGEGLGRNAIARELSISGGSVTRIAQDVGHVFDWKMTEIAVRAAEISNNELRERLAQVTLIRALDALDAMDAPHKLVHYQPKTKRDPGGWKSTVLDEPTPSDKRNYATIAGILITKNAELTRASSAAGDAGAISLVEGMAAGLQRLAERYRDDPDSDPTTPPAMDSRESLLAEYSDAENDADPDA